MSEPQKIRYWYGDRIQKECSFSFENEKSAGSIADVFFSTYGEPLNRETEKGTFVNCLLDSGVDCETFYQKNGAKITRPVKSAVMRYLELSKLKTPENKKLIEQKWADFCNRVSELYTLCNVESFLIQRYFERGRAEFFGDGCSCFYPESDFNPGHGEMLDRSASAFVLGLVIPGKGSAGRMLLYTAGPKTAVLQNRYNKPGTWEIPVPLFVRALENMIGNPVTFKRTAKQGDLFIPVYMNGSGSNNRNGTASQAITVCTGEGIGNLSGRVYRFTCPTCGDLFLPSNAYIKNGNGGFSVCSSGCRPEEDEDEIFGHCEHCGDAITDEEDLFYACDCSYCRHCFERNFSYCDRCEQSRHADGFRTVYGDAYNRNRSNYFCEDCAENHASICSHCENCYEPDQMVITADGGDYCLQCAEEYTVSCSDCGETYENPDQLTEHGRDLYCDSCLPEDEEENEETEVPVHATA